MLRLILAFIDIAVHRRGPEHLPASGFLLGLTLAAYLAVGLTVLQTSEASGSMILYLLFDTMVSLAFVWAVLQTFNRRPRFMQTASAMYGTDALLSTVGLPLLSWSRALRPEAGEITVPDVLLLVLFCWSVDVSGFVLSRALDRPYVVGLAIMIGYVLLSISLRATLLPVGN